MFQLLISIFFISFFSSCHVLNKSYEYKRKTASQENNNPFEFKTVETNWLKAHPEIYKELKKIIDSERKEIKEQAINYQKNFPNSKILPFKLNLESLTEFNKKDSSLVSVRARIYTFKGGVHGMVYHVSWNWDQKQKRFLSLSDYIKTEAQFKKIKSDVKRTIWQNTEMDPSMKNENWFEKGFTGLQDIKTWNIDKDKLIVMFDPYQIAPYSAGWIEASVSKP